MIHFEEKLLSKDSDKALRIWLSKPELDILRRVVLSKQAKCQVRAANAAVKAKDIPKGSEQGEPNIVKLERGAIISAQRYQDFLEILDEISKQDDPFTLTQMSC